MKISRSGVDNGSQGARIAASSELGTTYYSATLDAVKSAFKQSDSNIWVAHLIDTQGFDCINMEKAMHGCAIVDDVLYICITDGKDISVGGESVDPVSALKHYSPSELSMYVEEASPKMILGTISEYELIFNDIDKLAEELMAKGYTFTELMDAALDINMLDK